MKQPTPDDGSEEVAELGEPNLICRISRKTLFWGFLLASLLCGVGVGVLIVVLRMLIADWSQDVFGSIIFLAVGLLLLWGGTVLWRKTNRKRHVRVVVHSRGLSYRNEDNTCLTCRWDEIEAFRWRAWVHREKGAAVIGGAPVVATTTWTTHQVIVQLKDGVQLVFTDELQHVVSLAKAIQEATSHLGDDGR
jgi:hypothetical protein